jgi:hypothetical protein
MVQDHQISRPGVGLSIFSTWSKNGLSFDMPAAVRSDGRQHFHDRSRASSTSLDFAPRRWIDPPSRGWYSGDRDIQAAGCCHYESPTEAVRPEDMMRHVLGEALSVGSVLNWGPSYYHQRQYFEGKDNKVSTSSALLRYDLEVSGFPSSHCGHLVLLRLRTPDYPDCRQLREQIILNVPRYDFNWQLGYDLAEPIKVPKGTKLVVRRTLTTRSITSSTRIRTEHCT